MPTPAMRIAYLGQMADVSHENGICKKIAAQGKSWLHAGHAVRYFSLTPTTKVWPGLAPLEADLVARGGAPQRMLRSFELARRIRAWQPDLIYFRYGYHSAGLPALFREIPTVAELNSDDLKEYPLTLSRAKQLYHRLTRGRVLWPVAGFVPVTHELETRFAGFRKPAEVIANGIALEAFPQAPVPAAGAPLRLVFIGSRDTPWHGLERVAEIGTLFPEAIVDVIGTEKVPAPANVVFHGELPRTKYEPLLLGATAALGTLGLFRKHMDEACPLKVREYLALGLPVLGGYRDTDIPDSADYFLRVPNDSAPLAPHRHRIAQWLEHWRERRVPRADVAHLDNAVKEKRRLDFLHRLVRTP
jgi:glycosyltransferase involved in cell wall biosynthesis